SALAAPLQPLQLAPLALRRPRVAVDALRTRHPHLSDPALTLGAALLGLGVELLRGGRGQAALSGAAHDRLEPDHALRELDRVAGLDVLARLRAQPVDAHAPAADGVDRERARLDETRGPQPLVDPDGRLVHLRVEPALERGET